MNNFSGRHHAIRVIVLSLIMLLLSACATKKKEPSPEVDPAAQRQAAYKLELLTVLETWRDDALEDSVAALQALTENYPEGVEAWVNLGVAYYRQSDYVRAERALSQALEVDAQNKTALNYLGLVKRQQGEFAQAESYYRQALEIDPDYPAAVRNLAILLDLYRGQLVEALALYEHYQGLVGDEAEPRLKDWIFDIKSRIE
ncbi:MAG: tetratricopeptide repeat protein [Oleiphilaceae bacterium]|nr:tetratricopeptide repeat protein [Oleiphilaceae bacterium]